MVSSQIVEGSQVVAPLTPFRELLSGLVGGLESRLLPHRQPTPRDEGLGVPVKETVLNPLDVECAAVSKAP